MQFGEVFLFSLSRRWDEECRPVKAHHIHQGGVSASANNVFGVLY